MRILVHGLVGTNLGGIETFLLNMNDSMDEECIFDYVIEEDTCIHMDRIAKKGGKVYSIASRNRDPLQHIKDILNLYKKKRNEYKTIYFNLSSASWIFPEIIAKMYGYRVIVHSHNAMLIDANNNCIYSVINAINRFILGHMSIVRLSCSELATKFLFGNAEAKIIYNGIDVKKYAFSSDLRKKVREIYAISDDTFVVGVVGRLAYQKNPLFSVDVFHYIQKHVDSSVMFMIGDGKLREEVQDKIQEMGLQEKVHLLGNIKNVNEILNAMDVFLLPSRHEGLGIVLIEAQANGLPCYTSKDVVPEEARVTELLEYISLDDTYEVWGNECLNALKVTNSCREKYSEEVKRAGYEIEEVAVRLQKILFE